MGLIVLFHAQGASSRSLRFAIGVAFSRSRSRRFAIGVAFSLSPICNRRDIRKNTPIINRTRACESM